MSAQLRTMAHEGCRLTVYDDATGEPIVKGSVVKGNPTIGYGHLLCAPGGISKEQAAVLFDADWTRAAKDAATLPCFRALNAVRQGVLTEMVFQLGINGVRAFKRMLAALDEGNYVGAAREMLASRWAEQTPERARMLAGLMASSTS